MCKQKFFGVMGLWMLLLQTGYASDIDDSSKQTDAIAESIEIGDPHHPEKLASELSTAYHSGSRHIVIRSGTYALSGPTQGKSLFLLRKWKDVVISAPDVELLLTSQADHYDVFHLESCENVVIEGVTILQTKEPAFQGRINAMSKDSSGNVAFTWKPDAGYPVPQPEKGKFPGGVSIADPVTHRLKTGVPDYYGADMMALPDGSFIVALHKPSVNFGVGDYLLGRNGSSPFKFYLSNCIGCTIRDVIMKRNGFSAIREDGGRSNHFLRCVWDLGPRPVGATVDPLVSCTADGLHSTNTSVGPTIEYCEFRGILLDDPIAIHGSFVSVLSGRRNTMTCHKRTKDRIVVGHRIRITSEKGFIEDATVMAINDHADSSIMITIDKSLDVPAGAKFSDLATCGQGSKIAHCFIGNTRSRGILLKGDNATITHNYFENCGQAAISLGPEFYWNEANYVRNIVISENKFTNNGNTGGGGGVIFVHGEGALGNANIQIRNNTMTDNFIPEICLEWTSGASISDNTITGVINRPAVIKACPLMSFGNSRNIKVSGNSISNTSSYSHPLIIKNNNVRDLRIAKDGVEVK